MNKADDVSDEQMQIDPKVARLVNAMNSLAGVSTFSSCGGHKNPTGSQVASNRWYVNFLLTPHQMAWASLELIAFTAMEIGESVALSVWHDGGVNFELRGIDVKADDVAYVLEEGSNPERIAEGLNR